MVTIRCAFTERISMKNLVFAFLLASTITVAQPPNWRMDDALSATRNPTVAAEVDRLLSLTAIYATSDLLRELDTIANGQWNDAQVDWIFEQYAIGLRDAFPDTVTSAALNHLASYEVRALVPHPDSDGYGVPAFPVDTHIHRLAQRWGLSNGSSVATTEQDLKRLFPKSHWNRLHLQIIFYGREYCSARGCNGTICPLCKELFPKRRKAVITQKA